MKHINLARLPDHLGPDDHGAPVSLGRDGHETTVGYVHIFEQREGLRASLILRLLDGAPDLHVPLGSHPGRSVPIHSARRFDLATQADGYARLQRDGRVWTTLRALARTGRTLTVTRLTRQGVTVHVGSASTTAEW